MATAAAKAGSRSDSASLKAINVFHLYSLLCYNSKYKPNQTPKRETKRLGVPKWKKFRKNEKRIWMIRL